MRASVDRWFSRPSQRFATPGPSSRRRNRQVLGAGAMTPAPGYLQGLDVAEIKKESTNHVAGAVGLRPGRGSGKAIQESVAPSAGNLARYSSRSGGVRGSSR